MKHFLALSLTFLSLQAFAGINHHQAKCQLSSTSTGEFSTTIDEGDGFLFNVGSDSSLQIHYSNDLIQVTTTSAGTRSLIAAADYVAGELMTAKDGGVTFICKVEGH